MAKRIELDSGLAKAAVWSGIALIVAMVRPFRPRRCTHILDAGCNLLRLDRDDGTGRGARSRQAAAQPDWRRQPAQ